MSLGNAVCFGCAWLVVMPANCTEVVVAGSNASLSGDHAMRGATSPSLLMASTHTWRLRQELTQQLRRNLAACYDDVPSCIQLSTQTIDAARNGHDATILAIAHMQRSAANLRCSGFESCRGDFEQAIQFRLSPDEPELFLLFQIARTMVEQPVNRGGSDCLQQLADAIAPAEGLADSAVLKMARFELATRTPPSWKQMRRSHAGNWTLARMSPSDDVRINELLSMRSLMLDLKSPKAVTGEIADHVSEILSLREQLKYREASRRIRGEAECMAAYVFENQGQHDDARTAFANARDLFQKAGDPSLVAEVDLWTAAMENQFGNNAEARVALSSAADVMHLIDLPPLLTQMVRTASQIPDFARRRTHAGIGLTKAVQYRLAEVQRNAKWLRDCIEHSQSLQLQALLHETEQAGEVLTSARDSAIDARDVFLRLTGIGLLVSCGLAAFLFRERWRLRKLNERLQTEIHAREIASLERERMELHLAQSARLDSLGDLAGGIAHDFNNLLVGVLGNAELLRYSHQVTGDAAEYLDGITQSAERAADLSRKMLAYAGKQPAQKSCVELNELVGRMLPLFRPGPGIRHQIEFVPSRHPVFTEDDEGQLDQILLNLVNNSAHAIRQGTGTISFRVGVETLEDVSHDPFLFGNRKIGGEFAWFEISDSGDGIAESDFVRVFEPFYSTRPKETSHGFGLAVVYGHVNRHNGFIRLKSVQGVGTTFRILLPRQSEFHASHVRLSSMQDSLAAQKSLSVVIVDDQLQVLQVVERSLQTSGWVVRCFTSVGDAMEFMSDDAKVDCVVLDLMMPGVEGTSMLEEMQQRGMDIPVVVMSGFSTTDIDDLGRFPAVTSYLQKPFKPEQLQCAIRAAVNPAAIMPQ